MIKARWSIKKIILKTLKLYQIFISPSLGANCRFYPSCSEYTRLAIVKYGLIKGLWKGLKRMLRCYPWNLGGIDMP